MPASVPYTYYNHNHQPRKMTSCLRHFIIVLIVEISCAIQDLENIRSISIFVPDPCYKKANWGNNVIFNYIFRLENESGLKIDSSNDDSDEYMTFQIGGETVIRGLHLAAINMCIGEKKNVFIPPELGYGAQVSNFIERVKQGN